MGGPVVFLFLFYINQYRGCIIISIQMLWLAIVIISFHTFVMLSQRTTGDHTFTKAGHGKC